MKCYFHQSIIISIMLGLGIVFGFFVTSAPDYSECIDLNLGNFEKMMTNLERLAVEPHPIGSAALEKVRNAILNEISDMGYEASIQSFSIWENSPRPVELHNILVKVEVESNQKGILLVSHYDSSPNGPGAADDMVSVCAMLEALREVNKEELKNNLYFLFTDGEEKRFLGAKAFVDEYTDLLSKVEAVFNFEAIGNAGSFVMFQTSENDLELVRLYSECDLHPIAFSASTAIFDQGSNRTDLSVFLRAGYRGMDFALWGGTEHYHKPSDSAENLDRNSAYHVYKTISTLAGFFSTVELKATLSDDDGIYFPIWKGVLGIWSIKTAKMVALVIVLLSITIIIYLHQIKYAIQSEKKKYDYYMLMIWTVLVVFSCAFWPGLLQLFAIPLVFLVMKNIVLLNACFTNIVKVALNVAIALLGGLSIVFAYSPIVIILAGLWAPQVFVVLALLILSLFSISDIYIDDRMPLLLKIKNVVDNWAEKWGS